MQLGRPGWEVSGGRPRFVPSNTPRRRQAMASAQRIAFWDSHAHPATLTAT
jgi:hypothetical protein